MQRGSGFRLALIAALLLGHLGLPAHVAAVAASEHARLLGPKVAALDASARPDSPAAAHDPDLCPICLASSQARSGAQHTVPAGAPCRAPARVESPREPAPAPVREPELAQAPPRAPPVLALAFA